MKIVEIINRIGFVLLIPGPLLFFLSAARLAQGRETENTITWLIVGLLVMVLGLIMGNFKEHWLFEEYEKGE